MESENSFKRLSKFLNKYLKEDSEYDDKKHSNIIKHSNIYQLINNGYS